MKSAAEETTETGQEVTVLVIGSVTTMTWPRLLGQFTTEAAHEVTVYVLVVLTVDVTSGDGQAAVAFA